MEEAMEKETGRDREREEFIERRHRMVDEEEEDGRAYSFNLV